MCRWLAYTGSPVPLDEILYKPEHSLIDQSLHSNLGAVTTDGDGFGLGWYGEGAIPALYKSIEPAWNDQNAKELATQIRSRLLFAHVRASTGTPVQQTNCHPFRHGKWLWMHNGGITDFGTLRRELVLAIDPGLFPLLHGSTDSEVFFYLALTFGLEGAPRAGVARAIKFVEEVGRSHGINNSIRLTLAVSDGEAIWVFRHVSTGAAPSLFYSTKVQTLREQYPGNPVIKSLSDETRLIVSEPLSELSGTWNKMPEACCGVIRSGQLEIEPFAP